jgi:hypothetical protein
MKNNNKFLMLILGIFFSLISVLVLDSSANAIPQHKKDLNTLTKSKIFTYNKSPLCFEANKGQINKEIKFLSRGLGHSFFLKQNETILRLNKISSNHIQQHLVKMRFLGANLNPKIEGLDKLPTKVNYIIGNNPNKWLKGIRTYKKIKYNNIYPGIDLVYYGNQKQLEYDFVVSPGANPKNIKISFSGIEKINKDEHGELVLHTTYGDIIQRAPIIYQVVNGVNKKIEGGYEFSKDGKSIGFNVLAYDQTKPLIIDPVLVYSTFLGGINNDFGWAVDVDSKGNAYVAGSTLSVSDFPTTSGVVQPNFGGGAAGSNIFVTKFNPQGTPVYSTYLGGSGLTFGFDIKVDKEGNVYVGGTAYSQTSFPTTMDAFQPTFGGGSADAVIAKLNPAGSSLVFSTFLGGASFDGGTDQFGQDGELNDGNLIFDSFWHLGIDIDAEKNVYVTGTTFSLNFPTTMGAFQVAKAGSGPTDAFVTKLNPSGSALIYSTFLGGGSAETGNDIAVDASGNAYLAGSTGSTDFPTTQGSFLPTLNSPGNGYVAKLNPSGSALVYSSYLGGSSDDSAFSIDIDDKGNAYVTGETAAAINPPFFPVTEGVFQMTYAGGVLDTYVTKVNPDGSMLVYSTFLGGTQAEHGNAIAVDKNGNAYVIGHTNSNDYPVKDQIQTEPNDGNFDVFVTKLNPSGSALDYSTYLGGSQFEDGLGIAVDSTGAAYIAGYTEVPVNPPFFPTTSGAFQGMVAGNADAFVAKISGSLSAETGPDLTGSWLNLTGTCMGKKEENFRCMIKGRLEVENIGTKAASRSFVKFFSSSDPIFDSNDTFLKQVSTGKVKVERSKFRTLAFNFQKGTTIEGKFILAVLDANETIDESDETNNTIVFGPLP